MVVLLKVQPPFKYPWRSTIPTLWFSFPLGTGFFVVSCHPQWMRLTVAPMCVSAVVNSPLGKPEMTQDASWRMYDDGRPGYEIDGFISTRVFGSRVSWWIWLMSLTKPSSSSTMPLMAACFGVSPACIFSAKTDPLCLTRPSSRTCFFSMRTLGFLADRRAKTRTTRTVRASCPLLSMLIVDSLSCNSRHRCSTLFAVPVPHVLMSSPLLLRKCARSDGVSKSPLPRISGLLLGLVTSLMIRSACAVPAPPPGPTPPPMEGDHDDRTPWRLCNPDMPSGW
mmetsp:Transcript_34684/g.67487  ORF Transcript_34684/g.67487 Transcript_34684/m.67487 type:complete len:280 (+) Transcript_34684:879-1718(+)